MSLYFQATLTRVWSPKGQTPVVRVSPQRDKVHFYGVLDLTRGRELALTALEQTAAVTADFLRLIVMLFPAQHLLLLMDRAPWHFGPAIRQVLAENPHLELLYYPLACPDLNPQEHVWQQAREAISHNHSYRSFQPLIDDFETFLNETPFDIKFLEKYASSILCQF